MSEILDTVNHTTVEALGFNYNGRKLIVDEYADEFKRGKMYVRIYDSGTTLGIFNGMEVPLSLTVLKSYIRDGILQLKKKVA